MLRIDINMLFTVINVLLLVVAVRLLLWKPIHRILEQRQAEADTNLALAEQLEAERSELAAQRRQQADSIARDRTLAIEEAHTAAMAESERILSSARAKAEGIVAQAEEDAAKHKSQVMQQTQSEISELILTATAKVTGVGGDSELYDAFLEKAGNGDE